MINLKSFHPFVVSLDFQRASLFKTQPVYLGFVLFMRKICLISDQDLCDLCARFVRLVLGGFGDTFPAASLK